MRSFLLAMLGMLCISSTVNGLKASGNKLVDETGKTVVLQGFSHAGTEYACAQGWGIFEGPTDDAAILKMKEWKVNVVRVPLNEHCWLGINGVNPTYGGQNYRNAIGAYVNRLNSHGFYVIIDLHWTLNGSGKASQQAPMPNMDHSVDFWKSCASFFKGNQKVIFDIFNEPFPDHGGSPDTNSAWTCLRDGGHCAGFNYEVAGMQTLVNAVRGVGAPNLLMIAGITWSNDLSQLLKYMPKDPQNNLAASTHIYNFNGCSNPTCWAQTHDVVGAHYPIIIGEFGQNDCSTWFVDQIMNWAQPKGYSRVAWTYNAWDCGSGPALITDYNGGVTNFGAGVKRAFQAHPVV